ncbi:MAG: response regulator, partial [Oscillospiraceae bacterium]|nr:response regulator [Oscillospiraceae bacterium]
VNLTDNECKFIRYNKSESNNEIHTKNYEQFIFANAELIPNNNHRMDFLEMFNRNNLLNLFSLGITQKSIRYKIVTEDNQQCWIETHAMLVDNSDSKVVFAFISKDITTEMAQIEHLGLLMKKEKIYKNVINSDAAGYFEVNLSRDVIMGKIYDYYQSPDAPKEVDPKLGFPVPYSKFMQWSLSNVFKSNVRSYILNTDKEYLISMFQTGKHTHSVNFWTYSKSGQMHYFKQIYYMSRDEKTGDIIALCILKNEKGSQKKEAELKRDNEIISVLSDEYTTIFYVDIENKVVLPYRITPEFKNLFRIYHLDNKNYSEIIQCYIDNLVIEDDRENVRRATSVDNIRKQLYSKKNYTVAYRSLSIGVSRFFEMKFAKFSSGTAFDSFVLGFTNKDEQFRREKERQGRMIQNNEIISVLAREYEFVFYIDLETDTYTPYNLTGMTGQIIAKYMRMGHKYSQIKEMYINNWVIEDDRERMRKEADISYIKAQLFDKKSFKNIFRGYTSNLDVHYYEMHVIKVDEKNIPTSIVLGIADKNDEIRRQNEYNQQLKEARDKAEDANKAKSTFLFNMSHDIRTPMNAILGFTSMAKKYIDDPEKINECLEKVEISGNHLLSLINDVLDMARIESNKIIIEETPNNLRENMEQLVEILRSNAQEKDLTLLLEIKNLVNEDIYADALRLNRVIMNIMSNSLKYTKPGGTITVTVQQLESDKEGYGKYDLIFSDTGIGMSKQFLETIFDAFTREKTSTVSGIQGTGLGMAITKNFIELMGGTIEIDSALGLGTTVTCHMYFRLQTKEIDNESTDDIEEDLDFSNVRILLVEDNDLNREIAKDILEDVGIEIEEATDGSVAVDMITANPAGYYDLVFMDIQMPYMDGYKATQAIRNLPDKEAASVPIIAMTANAFEEDKKKAYESGMNGHLAKPLNIHELFKAIYKHCKK